MADRLPYRVYIDWDRDGFDAADEIGAEYVRSVSWSIGMRPGSRVASVGKCTLVLVNTDRRFSPAYADGPLHGKLLPNLPVRVDLDGETLFRGVTDSFEPSPLRYSDPTCTVRCSDLLSKLRDYNTLSLPVQLNRRPDQLLRFITSATFGGDHATLWFDMHDGVPTAGEYVTVAGRTYTYATTPSSAYQVKTGATIHQAVSNLAAAVNAGEGIGTTYGSGTVRHPYVALVRGAAKTLTISPTLATSWNQAPVGGGGLIVAAQRVVMPLDGQISSVLVWIHKTAADPVTYPLVCQLRNETSGRPGSTIFHSVSRTGAASGAYLDTGLRSPYLTAGTPVWITFSSNAPSAGDADYRLYATKDLYADGWTATSDTGIGSTWYTPFGGDDLRVTVEFMPRGRFESLTPGAYWNALTGASNAISLAAGTFSGATDEPDGLIDFETDTRTLDIAGGEWRAGETNALRAVQDVVESVAGFFWAARDGKLTYRSLNWFLLRTAEAPALTIDSEASGMATDVSIDDITNVVTANALTRRGLETGVLAEAPEVISVPGRWGEEPIERWTSTAPTAAGVVTQHLSYVNPDTGKTVAALSVAHPIAGTDYTVNDQPDGSGYDYTNDGLVKLSIAPGGAGMAITLSNTALGTLYVRNLRVKGQRYSDAREVKITRQDDTSIALYGRRAPLAINLPFTVSDAFAEALVDYTLGRVANPVPRVRQVSFTNVREAGGVDLFGLEIGDVIEVSDYQTGIEAQKSIIVGIDGAMAVDGSCGLTFALERIDDITYWILENVTYGLLGDTTRLGV